ncbi:MAG: hypothetical protein EBU21_03360 [Proteobacteria bacterium]|nr:hypothetical protein [Pseudomonadota bacterium]
MTSTPQGLHETIITDRLASQLARDRASRQMSITDEALSVGVPIQDARLFWVHALLVRLSGNNPLTWHQSHTRAIPK